jgi:hypothetical protein
VNRDFDRDGPNQLWMTDITEHPSEIFDWIEAFYNRTRRHSALGIRHRARMRNSATNTPTSPDSHATSPQTGGPIGVELPHRSSDRDHRETDKRPISPRSTSTSRAHTHNDTQRSACVTAR